MSAVDLTMSDFASFVSIPALTPRGHQILCIRCSVRYHAPGSHSFLYVGLRFNFVSLHPGAASHAYIRFPQFFPVSILIQTPQA